MISKAAAYFSTAPSQSESARAFLPCSTSSLHLVCSADMIARY